MSQHSKKQRKTREDWQKKESSKGRKSMRGKPDNPYGELKKSVTLSLTPTALSELDQLSRSHGISRSELLERLGRQKAAFFEVNQPEVEASESPAQTDAFKFSP